jgi:NADPH-dependent ferric siderophore reductase
MTDALQSTPDLHRVGRVRHDIKRRLLTVTRVAAVTPAMLRITLTGADLPGFVSAAYDDHVKLFFPRPGEDEPRFPAPAPADGAPVDEAARAVSRDYTPRRYDPSANELDIDFAIHEAGPATQWAMEARPGSLLGVAGPRGSFVVTDDFDWSLFVGDETALPAIGRRIEELRAGTKAIVIAEVTNAAEEQRFAGRARIETTWVHRGAALPGTTTLLDDALTAFVPPAGDGYAWVAGEALTAKRLRAILVERHRHPKAWLKAAGYWKRGVAAIHENIED